MRFDYINCNSFDSCPPFISGKKFAQTNYTVAVTVRCFGAFVTDYCCSDSLLIVKLLFFVTVAVTVLGKIDKLLFINFICIPVLEKKLFFSIYWSAYPVVG